MYFFTAHEVVGSSGEFMPFVPLYFGWTVQKSSWPVWYVGARSDRVVHFWNALVRSNGPAWSFVSLSKTKENMTISYLILIGAVAGWLAGVIMKGKGFGLLVNILLGILGAFVGDYLFGLLNISTGNDLIGSLITATVGAIVLVGLARLFR